ncbi:MAG: ABC transporter permease [Thermomicrobium sp.]|nr:ABC transporter permease [Thermomicrobium sp.]
MGNLLAAEFAKTVRRPMTWIALAILVAIMVTLRALLIALSFVSLPTNAQDQAMPSDLFTNLVTLPGALADTLNFIPSLGIFALLVVAASNAGTEFAWGTIIPLLSRGASRTQLVLAKALVLFGVLALYLLVTVLTGIVLGALASQLHLGYVPLDWLRDRWDDLLLSVLRSIWATVPYILGAIALAIVFRSSALAMGIVLAYVFVEQLGFGILELLRPSVEGTSLSWIFTVLDWTLLGQNASELQSLNTRAFMPAEIGEQAATSELHPWRATVVLALYAGAFLVVALQAIRRDVGTRPVSS